MKPGVCLAVALAVLVTLRSNPAAAQADAHARALARATCQTGKQSEAVTDAAAALEHDPNELGPRMRLADALVDQGCYQEAVDVLEVGQQAYPRNGELSAKLRDVRSLVTEQTYIEGLTQAAEGAKLQRNQLRCTRLADVGACDDALRSKPDDEQLLIAKGDALMQGNRPADAATAYRRASQLKPADDAVKTKLNAAEALVASITPPPAPASQVPAANTAAGQKPPKRTRAAATVAKSAAGVATGTRANGGSVTGVAASTIPNAGSAAGAAADAVAGARPAAGTATTAGSASGATAGIVANAGSAAGTTAGTAADARPAADTTFDAGAASSTRPASGRTRGSAATLAATGGQPSSGQHLRAPPLATVTALQPQEARTYSNDAPPGRTN